MVITSHSGTVRVRRLPNENNAAAYVIVMGWVNVELRGNGPTERLSWVTGDFPCAGNLEEWERAGVTLEIEAA